MAYSAKFMLLITTLFLLLTTVLAGVFANKFGKKQMMIGGIICYTACYLSGQPALCSVQSASTIAAIAYLLMKEKYALLLTAAEAKENGVEYRVEGLDRVL